MNFAPNVCRGTERQDVYVLSRISSLANIVSLGSVRLSCSILSPSGVPDIVFCKNREEIKVVYRVL